MNWVSKLISVGDEVSSKRLVGLIGSAVLMVTMVLNALSPHDITPSDALVDAVLILTLGCFGFTSIDKFSKKGSNG